MSENNLRKKAKALVRIHKYVETLPIMKEIMSSELDPKDIKIFNSNTSNL